VPEEPVFFATPAAWRAWLVKHHASEPLLWVGFHRRASGMPSITWPESVDEALCFGWIDGKRKSLDATRYMIRFSPRLRTSIWSNVNTRRFGELERAGRVRAAGQRAFDARDEKRSGMYSFERRIESLPTPLLRRLRAHRAAHAYFETCAPWYRRAVASWVSSAKREETRERRFAILLSDCAAGRPIAPLRRPKPTRPAKG
jgi:uncharacterized protein YdeI (YjbR/CyaY-like superfamily)